MQAVACADSANGTASVANTFGDLRIEDLQWKKRAWLGGWKAYGTSKIATILFTQSLATRGLEAYSFHPGFVATGFGSASPLMKIGKFVSGGRMGISAEEGAAPLVHLASVDSVEAANGTYFDGLKPDGRTHKSAQTPGNAEALWTASALLVGLKP